MSDSISERTARHISGMISPAIKRDFCDPGKTSVAELAGVIAGLTSAAAGPAVGILATLGHGILTDAEVLEVAKRAIHAANKAIFSEIAKAVGDVSWGDDTTPTG